MALSDYLYKKPVINTRRLRLRPLRREDIPSLREWMTESSVYTYWGKGPGRTEKEPERLFDKPAKPTKSFHMGIEDISTGKVIGDLWVYLIENDRMASVAIRLAAYCRHRGFGTEALTAMVRFCFENTELRRLYAEVDIRNTPSIKMLEKCGFIREGMIRQGKMVNSWCDYYIYGMLESDFRAADKGGPGEVYSVDQKCDQMF